MTSREKAEELKATVYQLYSKEGRSISYISKLLGINRKVLSDRIHAWGFEESKDKSRLKPSSEKFLNKNRYLIKSRLDKDFTVSQIAEELGVKYDFLSKIIRKDEVTARAIEEKNNRMHNQHLDLVERMKEKSCRNYMIENLENEIWKPVLGYPKYEVSNKGRVKGYSKRYKSWYLLSQAPNKNNGRLYVSLFNDEGRRNLQVSRLVGFSFLDGYSEGCNTINHKDGNVQNNNSDNLEWVSQSENNTHAYRQLNKAKITSKRFVFNKIRYQGKYEFKTVAALARFMGKSETQVRRYLDFPDKHDLELIQ